MELISTIKPNFKNGIRMPRDTYEAIKNAVMKVLDNEEGRAVPSSSFFEILYLQFVEQLGEDTGWYLYHVKLDLESRGLIEVEYTKHGRQTTPVIKIVRKTS